MKNFLILLFLFSISFANAISVDTSHQSLKNIQNSENTQFLNNLTFSGKKGDFMFLLTNFQDTLLVSIKSGTNEPINKITTKDVAITFLNSVIKQTSYQKFDISKYDYSSDFKDIVDYIYSIEFYNNQKDDGNKIEIMFYLKNGKINGVVLNF